MRVLQPPYCERLSSPMLRSECLRKLSVTRKVLYNGLRLTLFTGQTTLPDTCPVCMHSPLSADDCKPNKSLRLTVKAFLKNEEKKRDKIRADAALVIAVAEPKEATESANLPTSAQIPDASQPLTEDAPKIDNIVQSIETEDLIQPDQQISTQSQVSPSSAPSFQHANVR
jgi:hypothetical protein